MTNGYSLNYFHGALLDEDADKLLVNDGDFLLQNRFEKGSLRPKLVLAVKKRQVHRFEVSRNDSGYTILGKNFSDLKTLIEHYQSKNLEADGETFFFKKAVPKGKFQLGHKDIQLLKKIGSGAYGTVYKGVLLRERTLVAVKRIDSDGKNEQGLIDMMKEARVMQLYNHKNIVKFFGFIVDRAPYLLVMELCPDGSVEDKLRSYGLSISIAQRVNYCAQAGRGLKYLHQKNCIHRDIATRNCLLSGFVLKLADFGMCRATAIYKVDLSKPQNVRWLAPEVWRTGETKFCTDIYAFGIMMWELFEIPYNSPYCTWKAVTVKERVINNFRMPVPESMPESLAVIMKKCWDQDPNKRPIASELRKKLDAVNKEFNEEETERSDFKLLSARNTTKTSRSQTVVTNLSDSKSKLSKADDNRLGLPFAPENRSKSPSGATTSHR